MAFLVLSTRAATRIGPDSGAAHQAIRQVWVMSALLLDAFAISGQSLIGFFMGGHRVADARRVARVVCQWSVGAGLAIGGCMWLGQEFAAAALVPLAAHLVILPGMVRGDSGSADQRSGLRHGRNSLGQWRLSLSAQRGDRRDSCERSDPPGI